MLFCLPLVSFVYGQSKYKARLIWKWWYSHNDMDSRRLSHFFLFSSLLGLSKISSNSNQGNTVWCSFLEGFKDLLAVSNLCHARYRSWINCISISTIICSCSCTIFTGFLCSNTTSNSLSSFLMVVVIELSLSFSMLQQYSQLESPVFVLLQLPLVHQDLEPQGVQTPSSIEIHVATSVHETKSN